jgi:hypothetical protein
VEEVAKEAGVAKEAALAMIAPVRA